MMGLLACKPPAERKADAPATEDTPRAVSPASPLVERPFTALPNDGMAEVARYRMEREHYGVPLVGRATLLVVEENLDATSLIKTNEAGGVPAIKVMLMKTLPSMNWDHRDNLALFQRKDLSPLKLAITAEEGCGNNFMEWRETGEGAKLIGRPYTDDTGIVDATASLPKGYHLYEQMPLLVRAVGEELPSVTVRIVAPQTAYLPPHSTELEVTIVVAGAETIEVPAGSFETVRVAVTPTSKHELFPGPETYWLAKDGGFIVKALRHEFATELGKAHVGLATYTLLNHERSPYWQQAVGPATASMPDRERATMNSEVQLNLAKKYAEMSGEAFDVKAFLASDAGKSLPPEFLSDPKGNASFSEVLDGSGGWFYDTSQEVLGTPGRFVPNVK